MACSLRYYSEAEHPLGPPADPVFTVGPEGIPMRVGRDLRPWASVEWCAANGYPVPEDWRERP
jgi:hypothetical protein